MLIRLIIFLMFPKNYASTILIQRFKETLIHSFYFTKGYRLREYIVCTILLQVISQAVNRAF